MGLEFGRAERGESPLVIAHRGSSAGLAEHTLAAYRQAWRSGVDGVECDVRLTADHHLVCAHDRTADRTSNGSGALSGLKLAYLESLDWGSWKTDPDSLDPRAVAADPDRHRLLTLRRLLRSLEEWESEGDSRGSSSRRETSNRGGSGNRGGSSNNGRLPATGKAFILIETKHPTRHGGRVERTLAQVLTEFGLSGDGFDQGRPISPPPTNGTATAELPVNPSSSTSHVRVMSFSRLALKRMQRFAPDVPLVHLIDQSATWLRRSITPARGITRVGLDLRIIRNSPEVVAAQRDRGHSVYVWTVNEPDDFALCQELGVDVVITDRPEEALAQLSR